VKSDREDLLFDAKREDKDLGLDRRWDDWEVMKS
jgi:hypothetical protein